MRTTDVIGRDAELALTKDFLDALAADPTLRSAAVRARQAQNMKNGDTK